MTRVYLRPSSVAQALDQLRQHPDAVVLGGGTRVLGAMAGPRPEVLIDLAFAGIDGVAHTDLGIWLGAMVPLDAASAELPGAWREAVAEFIPRAVRRQATVGGNLCSQGSLLPIAWLLDAQVEIAALTGVRQVPIDQAAVQPGEVWTRVLVPLRTDLSGYQCLRRTPVGPVPVAVAVARIAGQWRAVVQAGGKPMLQETGVDLNGWPERLAANAEVRGDQRGSAEYRRAMVAVLAKRLLERLVP
jgi:CO/xanthine dehydrogenase FAD-binding subunit